MTRFPEIEYDELRKSNIDNCLIGIIKELFAENRMNVK